MKAGNCTAKAVKRANEMLIVSLKGELNGKNQRTAIKAERGNTN